MKHATIAALHHIETHPEQYNFSRSKIPTLDEWDTPTCSACLLAWIAFFADLSPETSLDEVAIALGYESEGDFYGKIAIYEDVVDGRGRCRVTDLDRATTLEPFYRWAETLPLNPND